MSKKKQEEKQAKIASAEEARAALDSAIAARLPDLHAAIRAACARGLWHPIRDASPRDSELQYARAAALARAIEAGYFPAKPSLAGIRQAVLAAGLEWPARSARQEAASAIRL